MRLELGLASRYLRSRRGSRFLSLISLISIGGVTVAVSALIVIMGVMTGLQKDLREKILIGSPDVRVLPWHVAPLATHMIEKIPPDLSKFLICPMPGLLVALHVGEGDAVEAGQPLATVEAMKMENILRAEKTGVVKTVNAAQGDSLAVDAVILEME